MASETLEPLSGLALSVRKGFYRHYKGNVYQLLGVARHSETLEEMVMYRALKDEQEYWVRPLSLFVETVHLPNGQSVPRFQYIGNASL